MERKEKRNNIIGDQTINGKNIIAYKFYTLENSNMYGNRKLVIVFFFCLWANTSLQTLVGAERLYPSGYDVV